MPPHRKSSTASIPPNYKEDLPSIALLLVLYVLQGIPLGLIAAIPMILQNRGVTYTEQATFSFAYWPFSVKLLYAPIVDSVYSKRFGRRKSWLVPMQYLMAFFMLWLSYSVDTLLDNHQIKILTLVFFSLNFLAATQDIAVDGWALTMLSRKNVGYASTCNSVGQTIGYFLGYVVFLGLESKDFSNYLRSVPADTGLVTLSGFFYFWSWVFLCTTTVIMIFKSESVDEEETLSVTESYKILLEMFKQPVLQKLILFCLTSKIAFAATDAATGLKLIEAGVPKADLAILAIPLSPLQIVLPLIISKYTNGPRPMNVFIKAYPYRILFSFVFAMGVYYTPAFQRSDGSFSFSYYCTILLIFCLHQVTQFSMFVAQMAFYALVSDPSIGGTYMTMLNTVSNLGGNWPATLGLYLIDSLSTFRCSGGWHEGSVCNGLLDNSTCHGTSEKFDVSFSGTCKTHWDGYYVETVICAIIGFIWLRWGKQTIDHLQNTHYREWQVRRNHGD